MGPELTLPVQRGGEGATQNVEVGAAFQSYELRKRDGRNISSRQGSKKETRGFLAPRGPNYFGFAYTTKLRGRLASLPGSASASRSSVFAQPHAMRRAMRSRAHTPCGAGGTRSRALSGMARACSERLEYEKGEQCVRVDRQIHRYVSRQSVDSAGWPHSRGHTHGVGGAQPGPHAMRHAMHTKPSGLPADRVASCIRDRQGATCGCNGGVGCRAVRRGVCRLVCADQRTFASTGARRPLTPFVCRRLLTQPTAASLTSRRRPASRRACSRLTP